MTVPQIEMPGGYAPVSALAFGTLTGPAVMVDATNPLPTAATLAAATVAPLQGDADGEQLVGPFVPDLGRPIWLTLSGTWTGSVRVLRSVDGGATRLPLSVAGQPWGEFEGNCNEPVYEETVAGAACYLALSPTSGSIAYAVSQ